MSQGLDGVPEGPVAPARAVLVGGPGGGGGPAGGEAVFGILHALYWLVVRLGGAPADGTGGRRRELGGGAVPALPRASAAWDHRPAGRPRDRSLAGWRRRRAAGRPGRRPRDTGPATAGSE